MLWSIRFKKGWLQEDNEDQGLCLFLEIDERFMAHKLGLDDTPSPKGCAA